MLKEREEKEDNRGLPGPPPPLFCFNRSWQQSTRPVWHWSSKVSTLHSDSPHYRINAALPNFLSLAPSFLCCTPLTSYLLQLHSCIGFSFFLVSNLFFFFFFQFYHSLGICAYLALMNAVIRDQFVSAYFPLFCEKIDKRVLEEGLFILLPRVTCEYWLHCALNVKLQLLVSQLT